MFKSINKPQYKCITIMSLASNSCPALVLNADFSTFELLSLSTWSWKDALKAVFLDRVNVVSEYNQFVRSLRLN